MSATPTTVTCYFSSSPLSSYKGHISGGKAAAPSSVLFPASRSGRAYKVSVIRARAAVVGTAKPSTNGSGPVAQQGIAQRQPTPAVVPGLKEVPPMVEIIEDCDTQLVFRVIMGGISEENIKFEVNKTYDYLIIQGRERQQGANETPSYSWIWLKNLAYDTHFQLPEDWDKSSEIKTEFDDVTGFLTVTVPRSKGFNT